MISEYHLVRLLFNELIQLGVEREIKSITLDELQNLASVLSEKMNKPEDDPPF